VNAIASPAGHSHLRPSGDEGGAGGGTDFLVGGTDFVLGGTDFLGGPGRVGVARCQVLNWIRLMMPSGW